MLKFEEWDKLYYSVDESIKDDVKNWFSRNFGGKIGKIDSIISELVSIEEQFAKKWEDIQSQITELREDLKSTDEIAERVEIKKSISEKTAEISAMERGKIQKIRDLNIQVLELSKGNQRISKYWNLKKAEAETEVFKNLYEISKGLKNQELEDELYKKYLDSNEALMKKEKEMDELIPDEDEDIESGDSKDSEMSVQIRDLLSLSLPKFIEQVRKYTPNQVKRVHRELTDQKNLGLNELRSLRRRKSIDLDNAKGKSVKESVTRKYNPMIYELGERIDRIREKISYTNE